jgi:hypothetical protein
VDLFAVMFPQQRGLFGGPLTFSALSTIPIPLRKAYTPCARVVYSAVRPSAPSQGHPPPRTVARLGRL